MDDDTAFLHELCRRSSGISATQTDDEDTEWLGELLGHPAASSSGVVVAGVAWSSRTSVSGSSLSLPSPQRSVASAVLPQRTVSSTVPVVHGGARRWDPPSIVAIRRERERREIAAAQQAERQQRARWGHAHGPLRLYRLTSQSDLQRCSSRSRSPRVCEERGRQETQSVCGVTWDYYCPEFDTPCDIILAKAEAAIHAASSSQSTAVPSFYVGVSRYVRRRWFGGDDLDFEACHRSRWELMHLLAMYSCDVGQAESKLIRSLKERYGDRCANVRGGGGGASRLKPSFLYICVGRT